MVWEDAIRMGRNYCTAKFAGSANGENLSLQLQWDSSLAGGKTAGTTKVRKFSQCTIKV